MKKANILIALTLIGTVLLAGCSTVTDSDRVKELKEHLKALNVHTIETLNEYGADIDSNHPDEVLSLTECDYDFLTTVAMGADFCADCHKIGKIYEDGAYVYYDCKCGNITHDMKGIASPLSNYVKDVYIYIPEGASLSVNGEVVPMQESLANEINILEHKCKVVFAPYGTKYELTLADGTVIEDEFSYNEDAHVTWASNYGIIALGFADPSAVYTNDM